MDVTTPEQAKIAEAAGASAVMALERIPADIRVAGRATQGVRLINIKEGDTIAAVSVVNKADEDDNLSNEGGEVPEVNE